jgi:hypothetical protein
MLSITSPAQKLVSSFEFRVSRFELKPVFINLGNELSELGTRNLKLILGGCGWSRTTNLALMRRLLFPLELHSQRQGLRRKDEG